MYLPLKLVAAALALLPCVASAEETGTGTVEGVTTNWPLPLSMIQTAKSYAPTTWHLLTRANNGTVSLVRGLTKDQCEFASNRLRGLPATATEKAIARDDSTRHHANTGVVRIMDPGNIATAECFE